MISAIQNSQAIDGTNGAAPAGATAPTASTSSILPAPTPPIAPITDLGAELAAMMVKTGQIERQQDEQERTADEKAQDAADQAQVAALHQKASDIESEGLVEGLTTVASGAMTLGSSVDSAQSSVQPAGSQAAADLKTGAAAWSFEATIFKGGGDIAGAAFKGAQANDDANAAAHASDSRRAKSAADNQSDDIKSDRDLINAAVDFYKQYTETKAQEQAALVHGA
jgi:hypothetical protein